MLAGMNVNVWDVVDDMKALILSKQPVDVGPPHRPHPTHPRNELGPR